METRMKNKETVTTHISPGCMDEISLADAEGIVEAYTTRRVIIQGDMSTSQILATNEVSQVMLCFDRIEETSYQKWADIFGLSFEDFQKMAKASVLFLLGHRVLSFLQETANDLACLISQDPDAVINGRMEKKLAHSGAVSQIMQRLPCAEGRELDKDHIADAIASMAATSKGKQRDLPDLASILLFQYMMDDFWKDATNEERLFYYPLKLWWDITSIIPTRPMEFLLTPRDCIHQDASGEWFITIRKDLLKHKLGIVHYRIDLDYKKQDFPIPESLALEMQEYQSLTARFTPPATDTFLVPEAHYNAMGRKASKRNVFFSYANLTCVLRQFYQDIVSDRYGFQVLPEDMPLEGDRAVHALHLGDSRHISLINLIAEGAQPQAVMELAGHTNPAQLFHYASNLLVYLKSASYVAYRGRTSKEVSFLPFPEDPSDLRMASSPIRMDNGYCFSARIQEDNPLDCLLSLGPDAELGWCLNCPYHSSLDSAPFLDAAKYLKDVKDDWAAMIDAVDHYRKEVLGMNENLLRALQRIQASLNLYGNIIKSHLLNRMGKGQEQKKGDKNGKT